jgi:hypothetical protein
VHTKDWVLQQAEAMIVPEKAAALVRAQLQLSPGTFNALQKRPGSALEGETQSE